MMMTLIDRLGDRNPQLFRELKGRLKLNKIALAMGISLLTQFLIVMSFLNRLPLIPEGQGRIYYTNRYCTGGDWSIYSHVASCFLLKGQPVVNWEFWWLDLFINLSSILTFALIGAGAFMLIGDLEQEERRETLNFIRLSPQSSTSIFLGKLLGVPMLLYLGILAAIPLHFWAGLSAKIPLILILNFDLILVSLTFLIFSIAMLFGLANTWIKGFAPWLGSGTITLSLWMVAAKGIQGDGGDFFDLFSPLTFLMYLPPEKFLSPTRIGGGIAHPKKF